MTDPKALALTILRNKNSSRSAFRKAAYDISSMLAYEALHHCSIKTISVETPLGKSQGTVLDQNIILTPILRSGLTMLPAFLEYFPEAAIAALGLKRDEQTAIAHWYYENFPPMHGNELIIILDPMIATGGTALTVLERLEKCEIAQKNIIFVAIIGSHQGIDVIRKNFPDITLLVATQDPELNNQKFIIPGLGDFGDRFFGTDIKMQTNLQLLK